MRIAAHQPKPIDKDRPMSSKRMDEIRKAFALNHAIILKSRDGVVSQPERALFDTGKPAFKAGEVKRVLLAGVDEGHGTWRLELSAAAFRQNGNDGVRRRSCRRLPFQGRCN